jgi:protein-tyrosine phosphatase
MLFFNKSYHLIDFIEDITDIHNHILPGIDDGSPHIDTTIDMIRAMKSIGIKNCIATPHTMEDYYNNDVEKITDSYKSTKKELEATDVRDFIINAASEYMMDSQFQEILENKNYLCIQKNYILTELSYFQRPDNLEELAFKMSQQDLIPILAHPERYRYFKTIDIFQNLKERGFELQLNLLSLTKHYGDEAYKKGKELLENDMYEFIGTDAHKVTHVEKIKEITIKKKQISSIKKLVENHKLVFNI